MSPFFTADTTFLQLVHDERARRLGGAGHLRHARDAHRARRPQR